MRDIPGNPNTFMAAVGTVSSVEQAALLDRIVCVVGGRAAYSTGGVVEIGDVKAAPDVDSAFSYYEIESASSFNEEHPDGFWGLALTTRPIAEEEARYQVERLFLLGVIPNKTTKIALVWAGTRVVSWYGGVKLLNEAGIPIVEDSIGIFTDPRYDPASVISGKRSAISQDSLIEIDAETAAQLDEKAQEDQAAVMANRYLNQVVVRASRELEIGEMSSVVSFGTMSLPKQKVSYHFGQHRSPLFQMPFILPKGSAGRERFDNIVKFATMVRVWNAYLRGFGISLGRDLDRDLLEELACSELRDIIERIGGMDGSDIDEQSFFELAFEAASLSCRDDEMSMSAGRVVGGEKLEWSSNRMGYAAGGSANASFHPMDPTPTVASKAIDVLVSKLNALVLEMSGDPGDVVAIEVVMKVDGELRALKCDSVSRVTAYAKNDRWAVVSLSAPSSWRMASWDSALCAIAAGWTEGLDLDGIAVLRGNFEGIDRDQMQEAFDCAERAGVLHIADWGSDLGCRHLEDVCEVVEDPIARRQGAPDIRNTHMKNADVVVPWVLEELADAGRDQVLAAAQESFVSMVGALSPESACEMVRVLSGGSIDMDPASISSITGSEKIPIMMRVLQPAVDFFENEASDEIERARDLIVLWRAVLRERGFELAYGFPIGVSAELFDRLCEAIGIESYAAALAIGVPVGDIVDVEEEEF